MQPRSVARPLTPQPSVRRSNSLSPSTPPLPRGTGDPASFAPGLDSPQAPTLTPGGLWPCLVLVQGLSSGHHPTTTMQPATVSPLHPLLADLGVHLIGRLCRDRPPSASVEGRWSLPLKPSGHMQIPL